MDEPTGPSIDIELADSCLNDLLTDLEGIVEQADGDAEGNLERVSHTYTGYSTLSSQKTYRPTSEQGPSPKSLQTGNFDFPLPLHK
jgi:hypothetical protein